MKAGYSTTPLRAKTMVWQARSLRPKPELRALGVVIDRNNFRFCAIVSSALIRRKNRARGAEQRTEENRGNLGPSIHTLVIGSDNRRRY